MPDPKIVFLDTSVLPRNPSGTDQATRALIELVENGIVRVFISDVVRREWTTQMVGHFCKHVREAQNAIESLARHTWSGDLTPKVEEIARLISDWEAGGEKTGQTKCDEYFARIKAHFITPNGSHLASVLDAYFSGAEPFASEKERKDIPDAFILAALRDVASSAGVLVGIKDGRLAEAASTVPNVNVYADLRSLAGSLKPKLDEVLQLRQLITLLKNEKEDLGFRLKPLVEEQLDGMEVTSMEIPEDNNEARVTGYDLVEDVEFGWQRVEDLGGGWLTIPFTCSAGLELTFYVYRADAFDVPDWVDVSFGDFETEHYFEASGSKVGRFRGTLLAKFSDEEIETLEVPHDLEVDDFELEELD